MLQWLAASAAGRTLKYHCFAEAAFAEQLQQAQRVLLGGAAVTVAHLYAALRAYQWKDSGAGMLLDVCTAAAAMAAGAAPAAGSAAAAAAPTELA